MLSALAVDDASYATVGTGSKFWARWKERPLARSEDPRARQPTCAGRQREGPAVRVAKARRERARLFYDHIQREGGRGITEQDRALWALCRPQRLLELADVYTVFDAGERKIARYQQHRCVERAFGARAPTRRDGQAPRHCLAHTQGERKEHHDGDAPKAIRRDPSIADPKIVPVTDRVDLDDQIYGNFKNCGIELVQATTGQHLLELLEDPRARIVTTLIHKFQSAVESRSQRVEAKNVFVLVDESHRTNFGPLHASMKRVLPNAMLDRLHGHSGAQARPQRARQVRRLHRHVHDRRGGRGPRGRSAFSEGRHVLQSVDAKVIDDWFERVSKGLSPQQGSDLKKRFSTASQLNRTEQKIMSVAWNISEHFRDNWQGTGFKAQLTAPSKADALLYKKYLDQFGMRRAKS